MKPPKQRGALTETPATHVDVFNIISDRLAQTKKPKTRWGSFFDKLPKRKNVADELVILQPTVPREAVFSARLGNRSRIDRSSSEESLCLTDLSLLSTSFEDLESIDKKTSKKRKKKGARAQSAPVEQDKRPPSNTKPKIDSFSTLGKLIASSATGTAIAHYGVNTWEEDEKTRELRRLIINCGKHNVIIDKGKSLSTTTLSLGSKRLPHQSTKRLLKRCRSIPSDLDVIPVSKKLSITKIAGAKTQKSRLAARLKFNAKVVGQQAVASNTTRENKQKVPGKLTKLVHGIMGIDLDKRASQRAKSKIKQTLEALDRLTGYGDPQTAGVNFCSEQDNFKYIPQDFSRIPYYPQRVKIAPQLNYVIKEDIGVRMGRPKYHELSVKDVEALEQEFHLDTYHRNLMIFNWLMSLEEDHFENYQSLVIVDPADVEKSRCDSNKILKRRLSKSASVLPVLN